MQNDAEGKEVLAIGYRLIESQEREWVLEQAYNRNHLPHTYEALLEARQLTARLMTEYQDATDAIPQTWGVAVWA
jgi:hypothetical protein